MAGRHAPLMHWRRDACSAGTPHEEASSGRRTSDIRHRRRRPGRGEGGRDAPGGGLHRPGDPDRRRARPPLRAPAAVQGLPPRQGGARQRLRPRTRLVRAGTTSSCTSARPSTHLDRDGQDRPPRRRHRRSTTTSCCWPPAPSRAAWTSRAPTWPASTTCAASPTPSGCKGVLGRPRPGQRPPGHRRRRLDRPGGRGGGPRVRRRGHRRRARADPAALASSAPSWAQLFADLHREHGVRFHFGARLTEIVGQDGMVLAARTDDGEEHPAHDVLAAIGAAPRTALAEAAGLDAGRPGARRRHRRRRAAAHLRPATSTRPVTSPSFHARRCFGTRLRVEHWANALNGGPAAARAMLGQDVTYDRVPYFFSDQYDLGLEYSGWAPPGLVRPGGDPRRRRQAASSSPSG